MSYTTESNNATEQPKINFIQWFRTTEWLGKKLATWVAIASGCAPVLIGIFKANNWFDQQTNLMVEHKDVYSYVLKQKKQDSLTIIQLDAIARQQSYLAATTKFLMSQKGGCYWYSDSSGQTVEVGPEAEALTGYKSDELVSYLWFTHVHPDDQPSLERTMDKCIKYGSDFYATFRMIMPNGDIIKIKAVAYKVEYKGKIIGWRGQLYRL